MDCDKLGASHRLQLLTGHHSQLPMSLDDPALTRRRDDVVAVSSCESLDDEHFVLCTAFPTANLHHQSMNNVLAHLDRLDHKLQVTVHDWQTREVLATVGITVWVKVQD